MLSNNQKNHIIIKRLLSYIKPYKLMIVGVLASLLFTSTAVLLIGKCIQYFIDNGLAAGNLEIYDRSLIILIAIVITLAAFTFLRFYLITKTGELIVADIRNDIFKHILSLSPSFYEARSAGEVISRMTSDATIIQAMVGSSVSVAARNFVMLFGGIIMLCTISMKLTLLIFGFIPLILMPIIYFGRKVRDFTRISQDKVAELSSICEQSVNYIRTIQAYRRETYEIQKFSQKIHELLISAFNRITLRSTLTALVISLAFGGIVFVLWIGGREVLAGSISAGQLSAFVFISVICAGAAGAITEVYGDFQKTIGAAERIFEFLSVTSDIQEVPKALQKKFTNPEIFFRNVTYSYDSNPEKKVLNNVSINFLPGKVNALVGRSGSGKSTILSLLQRFFDVKEGQIEIDGTNIKSLSLSCLRSIFTYVAQDPVIFSTTIYENIRYGKLEASEEEILAAAKEAECMDFINSMPQSIHSELGDKGVRLSGGQKQRIAIARAILNNPEVLLLDEATSSLDSENEQKIQQAIQRLIKGRTCIIVTHRLSTIKNADQIIVVDNGKIKETGKHEELIKANGLYSNLAKIQFELGSPSAVNTQRSKKPNPKY